MNDHLERVAEGHTLTRKEAEEAMHVMMRGETDPELLAAFLIGMRARGETLEELVGFTSVMREYAVPVEVEDPHAIDVCGTGGDRSGTFNISTAAAFVCAGAGVTVAKHGNRSVSSRCGSADVLEEMGVNVTLKKQGVEHCLRQAGMAFMFAPHFHPAMKHVAPTRRKLGVRTFFNILGPLCNPARVRRQLIGAFDQSTAEMIAGILGTLESDHIISVHSDDGMDELSLSASSSLYEYRRDTGGSTRRTVKPEDHRLSLAERSRLAGGDAAENARLILAILDGEQSARREVVLLNAAYALDTSGKFVDIDACFAAAEESIDSGAAKRVLARLVHASNTAPAEA